MLGLVQKVNISILGGGTLFHGGTRAGPSGNQTALGSGLGKGKEACNFDFTLLHFVSSWYLSCPCVPLLSIEENNREKYLTATACKPFLFLLPPNSVSFHLVSRAVLVYLLL